VGLRPASPIRRTRITPLRPTGQTGEEGGLFPFPAATTKRNAGHGNANDRVRSESQFRPNEG
jgi:hypothetical protein